MDEKDTKNSQDTRRVPIVRDGVGYTPGDGMGAADDFAYDFDPDAAANSSTSTSIDQNLGEEMGKTRKITSAAPRYPGDRPKPQKKPAAAPAVKKRKAPKKAHYAIFLVTTVFVSVIAMVFVFATMFNEFNLGNWGNDGRNGPGQAAQAAAPSDAEPEDPIEQLPLEVVDGNLALMGLVQELNPASRRMDLYVLETAQLRSFFVENHSTLRDKFGNAVDFSYFSLGDVIEVVHMEESTVVETARVSAQVRTYRNIRDVVVDTENNAIFIGNRRYVYTPRTVVMYHGEQNSITDVDAVDIVTVDVIVAEPFYGQVAFVDIHQGNGIIHIPENDMIIRGTVEVANTTFAGLDGVTELRVPEGDHRVTIRGDNIEIFEYQLTVARGGTAIVNLDGLELLSGSLTINVADPYASLTIDGEAHLANSMIMLDYGTYTVSVTRQGFVPFTQEITIDSANHEITVVLEEIILTQNVTIITVPAGARIYLDYQYVGLSPVSMELEQRRYTATTALEGFLSTTTDIWVTENQPPITWVLPPDPNFMATPMPTPTPPPTYQPTPTPTPSPPPQELYPEISPSPSPFFPPQ
ncbi:MAG: PEGA domain-containing protein [Clostridiales bacterium]|jgi:hypothetical protein|nr:PEGA domain-containing protein [Clostridiales bacterium]